MFRRRKTERRVLTVLRHPVGGIRTYLLYVYPHLIEAGYRFTFLGPADDAFRALGEEWKHWPGVERVEAPLAGRWCDLASPARRLLESGRFSLVHSQGFGSGCQVALANLGLGVPHVLTSHHYFKSGPPGWGVSRVKFRILALLLANIDAVVCVSNAARKNLLAYMPWLARAQCRVVTILNGIDTDRTLRSPATTNPPLRESLGLSDDRVLLGFLGRFMEDKGFLPLIDALRRLVERGEPRKFHLLAVGSGDYHRRYKAYAEDGGLARHVSFLPFVRDVGPLLRQIDLVVMPSLREAGPLLPMEAMVLGVPVLGSDCMGLREVLAGSPSRIARAGDVEDWCRALREAMAAPWRDEARAYERAAIDRFDVRRGAEDLIELFGEVERHKRVPLPGLEPEEGPEARASRAPDRTSRRRAPEPGAAEGGSALREKTPRVR